MGNGSKDSLLKFTDGSLSCDIPIKEISQLFNVTTCIVSQVNPHVVPLCWDLVKSANSSIVEDFCHRGKFLTHNAIMFALKQLELLGMLNRDTIAIRHMVEQTQQGHIQMVPHVTPMDYKYVLDNPTKDRFRYCLQASYLTAMD